MPRKKSPPPPQKSLPQMERLPWYASQGAHYYMNHVIAEVARLRLTDAFENSSRSDWGVLHELQRWFDDQPSRQIGGIGHWLHLDVQQLSKRQSGSGAHIKPRIELTAEITTKDNLTVRWFPAGYHAARLSFREESDGYHGDLKNRKFRSPPDFRWFVAGEQYANQRPNHEIMFIRGVGKLTPQPREFGPYAICNYDVLDAVLLCATRSAFDQLVRGLRESFDVTLLNDFEFDFEAEQIPTLSGGSSFTRQYVTGWRLKHVPPTPEQVREGSALTGEVVEFPDRNRKPDEE